MEKQSQVEKIIASKWKFFAYVEPNFYPLLLCGKMCICKAPIMSQSHCTCQQKIFVSLENAKIRSLPKYSSFVEELWLEIG